MSYTNWPTIINPPQDGEPIDSSTTARAHEALSDRTEYLKQRLVDYSSTNGRILIPSVQLMDDVNTGDVVYYDSSSSSYGKALAEGFVDPSTGLLSATARAFAIGICVSKLENYGDILVSGSSDLYNDFSIEPANLFDNASNYSSAGTRGYLSSLTPGKLTSKPVSPLIQLGMFSGTQSFVIPLQKDIFESHLHYRFSIPSKPAASQNTDKTGLKLQGDIVYIDYYDGPNTFPQLLLSIKKNDSPTEISSYNPARVKLSNLRSSSTHAVEEDGTVRHSSLRAIVEIGGVTVSGVGEAPSPSKTSSYTIEWPDYGQYVEIPETGLSVSFSRVDGNYDNALWVDMDANLIASDDVFKVFLPDDLNGWTNANLADSGTPFGSLYRLVHESVKSLDDVWPPTPLESTCVETNGINRIRDIEFATSMFGLFWKSAVPPWIWNGQLDLLNQLLEINGGSPAGASSFTVTNNDINFVLYFSKTSLENSRSVVLSLGSNSPMISITDCFTGQESSTGHLKIGLNLALSEETAIGSNYYGHALIDPSTNKFKKTTIVSDIVPGFGVNIIKNNNTEGTTSNCGSLTIGLSSLKLEGAIEVVSLINAKEDLISGIIPAIWFLQPSTGSYKMVSRVKIPNEDLDSGSISVNLYPSVFGSATQGSTAAQAVFNVAHYIVRNGGSLHSPLQLGYTTELVVPFANTTGYCLLDSEPIIPVTGSINAGDQIYTTWERVETGAANSDDSYLGNVGLAQVRWKIDITTTI